MGNTLKKHYETYLVEYEYAHDDVDSECSLLCRRYIKNVVEAVARQGTGWTVEKGLSSDVTEGLALEPSR